MSCRMYRSILTSSRCIDRWMDFESQPKSGRVADHVEELVTYRQGTAGSGLPAVDTPNHRGVWGCRGGAGAGG